MKNIKRFEFDVPTAFGSQSEYNGDDYPLQINDLNENYASAADGSSVAEIVIYGADDSTAFFQLGLEEIDALFEVLNHIKEKVFATKKPEPEKEQKS